MFICNTCVCDVHCIFILHIVFYQGVVSLHETSAFLPNVRGDIFIDICLAHVWIRDCQGRITLCQVYMSRVYLVLLYMFLHVRLGGRYLYMYIYLYIFIYLFIYLYIYIFIYIFIYVSSFDMFVHVQQAYVLLSIGVMSCSCVFVCCMRIYFVDTQDLGLVIDILVFNNLCPSARTRPTCFF